MKGRTHFVYKERCGLDPLKVELREDRTSAKALDRSASLQVQMNLSASVLSVPPWCLFLATPLQVGMGATNTACTG